MSFNSTKMALLASSLFMMTGLLSSSACISKTSFECTLDEQCAAGGAVGRCEGEGFCSFPDGECADGFRFGESSGDLAGQCVGDNGMDGGTTPTLCLDIKEIALGGTHSCVRVTGNNVFCWGQGISGQLGDDSFESKSEPVAVVALPDVIQISAGTNHTCALGEEGIVFCWGQNSSGQLGDGGTSSSRVNRPLPTPVSQLTNASAVSAGSTHNCAVRLDGTAACWGANSSGQLGTGDKVTAYTPVPVAAPGDETIETPLGSVTAIAAGSTHSCAVTAGKVVCWGQGTSGQLGDGLMVESLVPVDVMGITGTPTSLVAGLSHTCALIDDGSVFCWGLNSSGQIGDGTSGNITPTAKRAGASLVATEITAGSNHTCARTAEGSSLCWGANATAQVGQGSLEDLAAPVEVMTGTTALGAGGNHTCGVDATGSLLCWGSNSRGQLGDKSLLSSEDPLQVVAPSATADYIAAGSNHACSITGGAVYCWGANTQGQIGEGTLVTAGTPTAPLVSMAPLTGATKVFLGADASCSIQEDTSAMCWGDHSLVFDSLTPIALNAAIPTPITSISMASNAFMAVSNTVDEELWAGGWNFYGELGFLGDTNSSGTPRIADAVTGVTQVHAGSTHTCALSGNTVSCFGRASSGVLGDSGTINTEGGAATLVTLPANPVELNGGASFTCARLADNSISCWGLNSSGQLGNGTNTSTSTTGAPVTVALPANDAKAIIAQGAHACAIRADDTLWCWGQNTQNIFNTNPQVASVTEPVQVLATPIKQAAIGTSFLCVITMADNALQCWGTNQDGQLGQGRNVVALTPSATSIVCEAQM